MKSCLAIDQGTTGTKAYRVWSDGRMELVGRRSHQQFLPAPGLVEHDAEEILRHIEELIAEAGPIDALALTNQGETVVAWDAETGVPIGPAIVWQDTRTADVVARMKEEGLEPEIKARSGLPLDCYFSASRLRWYLDHVPQARLLREQGRLRFGTSDAFFLDRLCGVFVTDVSTASRTSLMNLRTCEWDETLCRLFDVPIECLPSIRPTVGAFGLLRDRNIPVRVSAVDQQAALYGHGLQHPGDVKITFGTGAFALALGGKGSCGGGEGGVLPTVAWRFAGRSAVYALEGGILTAGAAVNWVEGLGPGFSCADEKTLEAAQAAEKGVFFLPALQGLGCPWWQRDARGSWVGLGLDTRPADMARAVLEGIAFRSVQLVKTFAAATGQVAKRISVDGGLVSNRWFIQFLANCLDATVHVPEQVDVTAAGLGRFWLDDEATQPARASEAGWRVVTPRPNGAERRWQDAFDCMTRQAIERCAKS
ncbi:FGGY family carbohydrate kinase [Acetobacter sp. UBA5411]|uniref:FGGY family carbohydrate kinase n=1 Tax=Acetobacter sp. UBA5411 TaxID=1945905 RepID=UPI0025B9419B|nr:FGGY family carbohydrate kinase [Acetobacter sp. UBA5411]